MRDTIRLVDDARWSRRRFVGALGAGAGGAALAGCATNQATGRSSYTGTYSVEDEIRLGRDQHPKLVQAFGGEYENRRLQSYVERVGKKLAVGTEYQQYPYQFTLLNSPIVNAFALPGGFVYISRGLLALGSNEAEMAGVLSHELGHVNARHSAERMSSQQLASIGLGLGALAGALLGAPSELMRAGMQVAQTVAALSIQSYSRQQEFEADTLGVRYMSRAGYEPDAMVTFLSTLREQSVLEAKSMGLEPGVVDEYNMMSTHPRTVDRVREAQTEANAARPATPVVGRDEYLANIDGMLYGDDPEQGVHQDGRFIHPGLRFDFAVPRGYRVQNEPDKVVAQGRDGGAMIFDMAPSKGANDLSAYLQQIWAPNTQLAGLQRFNSSGVDGATGLTRVNTKSGQLNARLVAFGNDRSSVFRFVFLGAPDRWSALDREFVRTAESFRRLSAAEAARVKPLRVRVRRAGGNDRVERLARSLPYGELNPQWFRVINDLPPGSQPEGAQIIKVIGA